jgi:pimeloyl-ACP methyl ester carboxylesterase
MSRRALYVYFAKVGETELAYIESWRGDRVNADAGRLFGDEIVETFDLRPGLARITARTLVVVGEHDLIAGPVCGADILAGIPEAEVVTLPAGHFVFIECPDAFREAALGFLERTSSDQT